MQQSLRNIKSQIGARSLFFFYIKIKENFPELR